MYAQVCKRLRDEASSYEDNPQHASTFIRILLNVCRDKFYNPATASSSNSNNNNKNSNNNKSSENNSNTTNIKFDSKNLSEKDREYYNKENDDEITTEEEERRHVAKQRILGNVKFIGELSKLQMLSTSTIHRIIQDLFERKKRPDATLQDWCEDMECLCQLIRTCGKDLDSKPSQKLMDQYIAKMDQRSKSTEYPPRIRFMLRDIIELRDNNWVPRKVTATEGPVPIRQIRTDDDSVIRPPYISRNRDLRNNDRDSDHWMNRLPLNLQSSNFNDMFSSLSVTGASPIMSPGGYNNRNQRNNQNNYNNYNNNRYNKHNNQLNNMHGNNSVGSGLTGTNQFSSMLNNKDLAPRFKKSLITTAQESIENIQMRPQTNSLIFKANMNIKPPMLPISTPLTTSGGSSLSSSSNNTGITGLGLNNSSLLTSQQQSFTSSFKSDTSNGNNTSAGGVLSITGTSLPRVLSNSSSSGLNESSITSSSSSHGKSSVSATPTPVLSNNTKDDDIMLVTKHGSIEKPKGKKDKGPGKDKIIKGVITFLSENIIGAKIREDVISDIKQNESAENSEKDVSSTNSNENNQQEDQDGEDIKSMNDILALFYEIKVPDKHMKDVTYAILNEILDKNEQDHVNVIAFLQLLRRDNKLQSNSLLDAFKQIVNKMSEKESTIPKITTIVASLLALSVQTKLCKLSDIAVYTEGGQHYPLMLLVLQKLHKTMGRDSLEELFQQSKVDLMASLPEADRNKDRLAEILEDRKLTFLYPLLKVQQEMLKQIQLEDNPQIFYKWIKTNIDAKYHKDSGFITALMTVILKYVTQETMSIEGSDLMKNPDKSIIEKEEDLFQKYCHILEAFLTGDTQLQLIAVYALQVFCYNARFPKGMLCRWFKNLYESNVIEEEAFFRWKEEVTDEYPGKGTALFQVNQWLTWLEQAESEDED
ncbi:eukaryotic translation initiation factor 4 gamma 2 [Condylostylus longicornis]|uniref:eukaryotic translation initiation factor 4 gamma 2 n=1 Tax=Condylostylus longicornis TaxID=2530218 RepID=UPI00244E4488|nr:eukaryotic translation initiation factor 4 gamma 2 [Condylostylus longicornis]